MPIKKRGWFRFALGKCLQIFVTMKVFAANEDESLNSAILEGNRSRPEKNTVTRERKGLMILTETLK